VSGRRPLPWLARLTISVVVLALLFAFVPLGQLWEAIRQTPPLLWITSLCLFLLGHVLGAVKWRLLMAGPIDIRPKLWLSAHFAGLGANLWLPSVAGGDVVRAAWAMTQVEQKEMILLASLLDRAIDVFSLMTLAVLGMVWVGSMSSAATWTLLVAGGTVASILILGAALASQLARKRREGMAGRIVDGFKLLTARPWLFLFAFALSLLVQTNFVMVNFRLGQAAGVDVGPAAWFVSWPLAKLTASIPVSLAGIGVREAALVFFMRPFGTVTSSVFAAGLLWESVLISGGLVSLLLTAGLSLKPTPPTTDGDS
jgi:uncharacterized protein (TIRG00374 family)